MAGSPPPTGPYQQQGYPQQGYPQGQAYAAQQPNPAAPYGIDPKSGMPYSDKQKLIAGLLQIFLGAFAVGRFYTGHTGIAIAQILVTWGLCGMGVFWPLIDGIMMLTGDSTDAQGRPLRPN